MMIVELDNVEVRVLGCLIEKGATTPEYYPLTLNALKNACNQKSSRDPVVSYDEGTVMRALEGLRDKHLVWFVSGSESRVVKYKHRLPEAMDLSPQEVAALCLLMLRGPQTAGEIKGRSERLWSFHDPQEVETVLQGLAGRAEQALVARLPRQPGRKEPRFAHLLSGLESLPKEEEAVDRRSASAPPGTETRLALLEERLREFEAELRSQKEALEAIRKQLE
jgi:uncharacterized protein